jgi:hypothetical protein
MAGPLKFSSTADSVANTVTSLLSGRFAVQHEPVIPGYYIIKKTSTSLPVFFFA